jgi:hypothetical protein
MTMRIRLSTLSFLILGAISLTFGCASVPQTEAARPEKVVQVYEVDPYLGKGYDVVGRLWADSMRSRFWIPTFPTKEAALSAMQAEAAGLNADALISVSCVDQRGSTWAQSSEPAFLCYGVAIQLRQHQG